MKKLTRFRSHEELNNSLLDTSGTPATPEVIAARHAMFEDFIKALKAGDSRKASARKDRTGKKE